MNAKKPIFSFIKGLITLLIASSLLTSCGSSSVGNGNSTVLNAPSGLNASAVSASQIDLSWQDNSDNENGFEIERAADNSGQPGDWSVIVSTAADVMSYSDTGLTSNTKFYYRVRAFNSEGFSSYTEAAEAATQQALAAPAAPSGLSAAALSSGTVNLSWTDSSDNEDGFRIERAPDESGNPGTWAEIKVTAVNAVSFTDGGLSPSTAYHYRIRSYNSAGYSDYTAAVSVTKGSVVTASTIAGYEVAKESVMRRIPAAAIENAKTKLRIAYFHSSHGSRVVEGMAGLLNYTTGDADKYAFTTDGSVSAGKLSIDDYYVGGNDLSVKETIQENGHTQWYNETVTYIASHPSINVIMWSWCNPAGHNHDKYISDMEDLISNYPSITFVFMTGHPNGDGEVTSGNSAYQCHVKVTNNCSTNQRFCMDYWGIETRDMSDVYRPYANDDGVDFDNGNEAFYYNWQQSHVLGTDYFNCSCAHTTNQCITGNRITYASWWLWARIAGWDGVLEN